MRYETITVLVLLFALPAWGQPPTIKELSPAPIVAPSPLTPIPVEVNKYRWFSIGGYTGPVTWQVVGKSVGTKETDKALTLFGVVSGQTDPGEYPVPADALIVWGKVEGLTAVSAWGVIDGKAKQLLALSFIVGPAPPGPVDPVDPILTPFQVKLQAAYRADGATLESKSKYAALWRNAAKTTVYDTGLTTPKAVLDELKAAVKLLGIPPGSLDKTARAVADEINPLMPTPSTGTLTTPTRDAMAAVFARISQDLEVIK